MRKCIRVSYEYLEDLLGIAREKGRVTGISATPETNTVNIFYEDGIKTGQDQGYEAYIVQTLIANK